MRHRHLPFLLAVSLLALAACDAEPKAGEPADLVLAGLLQLSVDTIADASVSTPTPVSVPPGSPIGSSR